MSTVVVVKKDGFVTIGADTLTKLGSTKESADYIENKSKITKLGDSYFATVGHASLGLVLSSYFTGLEEKPKLDSPEAIFEFARNLHSVLKEDYYLNPQEDDDDPFESTQLDCLIANSSGIFGLYSLRSVQKYSKFYSFGTGYRIALGAMHALYQTSASSEEIAKAGIEAAATFDDSTGLPIEIFTIKLEG